MPEDQDATMAHPDLDESIGGDDHGPAFEAEPFVGIDLDDDAAVSDG
jgi:hypothetical protein